MLVIGRDRAIFWKVTFFLAISYSAAQWLSCEERSDKQKIVSYVGRRYMRGARRRS